MRIVCPTCESPYSLPAGALRPEGRDVRCARCGTEWHVPGSATGDRALPALPAVAAASEPLPVALPAPADLPAREAAPTPGPVRFVAGGGDDLSAALGAARRTLDAEPPGFARGAASRAGTRAKPGKPGRAGTALARPLGGLAVLAASIAVITGGIVWRDAVVRAQPDLAGLYALVGLDVNVRGLVVAGLTASSARENGATMLVVEGAIENVSGAEQAVPALRLALRAPDARELLAWSFAPEAARLGPGGRAAFRTTVPVPPATASEIEVRFTERPTTLARLP